MPFYRRPILYFGLLALGSMPLPAIADMGRAPVGPQGTYVSVEGGYLFQDGNDVLGYGLAPTPGTFNEVTVSPKDGWFVGGLIGLASSAPVIPGLPFHRVEGYFIFGEADDSATDSVPPSFDIRLTNVDGTVNFASGGFAGPITGHTSIERETWEGGFRLEYDEIYSSTNSLTWVFAPFLRNSDENTNTTVTVCCVLHRQADVETWLYGVVLAAEPEVWIAPGVALVGRLGVGVYGYDADGDFRSFTTGFPPPDLFAAHVSDDDSGVGFRGQFGGGLKFKLTSNATFETFAEADYFSHVGSAAFSQDEFASGQSSHVSADDLWELRAGARLNIGFSGPN